MVSVKVYVEGGGKGKALKASLPQKAFVSRLRKLGLAGRQCLSIVAVWQPKRTLYDRFQDWHSLMARTCVAFLLVNAERIGKGSASSELQSPGITSERSP